jgi:hypothetical protein
MGGGSKCLSALIPETAPTHTRRFFNKFFGFNSVNEQGATGEGEVESLRPSHGNRPHQSIFTCAGGTLCKVPPALQACAPTDRPICPHGFTVRLHGLVFEVF